MATQQVKFHSVTQDRYSSIESPNEGSLYFISDNGEIRKGSSHITGTRVFTAEDPTGTTGLSSLEVKVNVPVKIEATEAVGEEGQEGYQPAVEAHVEMQDKTLAQAGEYPKKGDMLVVKYNLGTQAAPKYQYSAYIYDGVGGTDTSYDADNWVACDGNVDASKVILTQNITMAGNYDKVGNFTKSTSGKKTNFIDNDTKGTAGVSVYELIKQMLSKTVEPAINAYPSVSLTVTNTSYDVEYGSTVTPTYSVSYADGNYKFDGGSNQAAGCARTAWVVTGVPDGTAGSGSTNSITATSSSQSLTVKAKATYAAGTNTPKNNLGDDSDIEKIPAGTTTEVSKTVTVTAYRKNFWLAFDNANMVDLDTVALDGTDTKLNSTYIRTNGHGQKANFSSIPLSGVEFQQVLIFLPKSSYLNKKLSAKTANNLPYIEPPGNNCAGGTSSPKTITIAGAGSDAGVEYCIWEIKAGSPVNGDTIALAWA